MTKIEIDGIYNMFLYKKSMALSNPPCQIKRKNSCGWSTLLPKWWVGILHEKIDLEPPPTSEFVFNSHNQSRKEYSFRHANSEYNIRMIWWNERFLEFEIRITCTTIITGGGNGRSIHETAYVYKDKQQKCSRNEFCIGGMQFQDHLIHFNGKWKSREKKEERSDESPIWRLVKKEFQKTMVKNGKTIVGKLIKWCFFVWVFWYFWFETLNIYIITTGSCSNRNLTDHLLLI